MFQGQRPLEATLSEIYRHYAPFIEELLLQQARAKNEDPLVGMTSDETLRRVYSREGYLQCLEDLRHAFKQQL